MSQTHRDHPATSKQGISGPISFKPQYKRIWQPLAGLLAPKSPFAIFISFVLQGAFKDRHELPPSIQNSPFGNICKAELIGPSRILVPHGNSLHGLMYLHVSTQNWQQVLKRKRVLTSRKRKRLLFLHTLLAYFGASVLTFGDSDTGRPPPPHFSTWDERTNRGSQYHMSTYMKVLNQANILLNKIRSFFLLCTFIMRNKNNVGKAMFFIW